MRTQLLALFGTLLVAAPAWAQDPAPADMDVTNLPVATVLQSATDHVQSTLSMTLFADATTGQHATVSVVPDFHPGCRVKFTLHF